MYANVKLIIQGRETDHGRRTENDSTDQNWPEYKEAKLLASHLFVLHNG